MNDYRWVPWTTLTLALWSTGLAAGAASAGNPPPPELSPSAAASMPAWLEEEMTYLAEGSGRWLADNRPHQSANEPADAYLVEWTRQPSGGSLVGRLSSRRAGTTLGEIWQYRLWWDPRRNEARLDQWGPNGSHGSGELRPLDGGGTECTQIFSAPQLPDWSTLHRARRVGADHTTTTTLDWDGKTWVPGRTYLWVRDPPSPR